MVKILAFIEQSELKINIQKVFVNFKIVDLKIISTLEDLIRTIHRNKPDIVLFQNKYIKNKQDYSQFMPKVVERFSGISYILITDDIKDNTYKVFSWGFNSVIQRKNIKNELVKTINNTNVKL